jgi:ribose transport system permease protein
MEMAQKRNGFSFKAFAGENSILIFLVVFFAAAVLFVPNFFSPFNMKNLVLQAMDIMIVAVGVTFLVLNGGIDFSCTSVLAMGSVFGAYVMAKSPLAETPWAIPVGLLAMVLVGALTGAVNGFAVVILKIPSFIATLATMMIGSGLAVWFTSIVTDRAAITGIPSGFFNIAGEGNFLWLPILITVVVVGFSYWLLKYTLFGRRVYAVGTNPKTAFISGIPVKKTLFFMILLSGIFAGIGSIIGTARNQAGIPSLGDRVFIDIIASIVIGGTSVAGGSGGVKQTIYGVLFITLLNNVVNVLGIEWFIISLVKGILVLIAAFVDYFTKRMEERRH